MLAISLSHRASVNDYYATNSATGARAWSQSPVAGSVEGARAYEPLATRRARVRALTGIALGALGQG